MCGCRGLAQGNPCPSSDAACIVDTKRTAETFVCVQFCTMRALRTRRSEPADCAVRPQRAKTTPILHRSPYEPLIFASKIHLVLRANALSQPEVRLDRGISRKTHKRRKYSHFQRIFYVCGFFKRFHDLISPLGGSGHWPWVLDGSQMQKM